MSNPPAIKSRRILPNPNHNGITTTTWLLISLLLLCSMPKHAAGQNDTATASSQPDTFTYGQRFNPSMAIIMVVLVSAFFLMGFFSVYIRQCAEGRMRGGGTEAASATGQYAFGRRSLRGTARGLDPAVIGTFPTFLYSSVKGLKIGKGSLECAVCLNEFLDDDVLRLLPRCSHVFHPDCIDAWLSSHITCPVCRANLVPKPGENIDPPTVQTTEPGADHGELPPPQVCVPIEGHHCANNTDAQPPQVEENPPMDKNKPPRSRSTGMRFTRLFPFSRSHSTGHSLIQPGEDRERFTLRLPAEVRNQIIMDARLNRAKSCTVAFPRVRSVRTGYRRSDSGGITRGRNFFNYERFDREERTGQWGFSNAPPFIRTGSARSSRGVRSEETGATPPKSSPKPGNSSQFDRLFWGLDVENGERSTDKPRPETQV